MDWIGQTKRNHWGAVVFAALVIALVWGGGLVPPPQWFTEAPAMVEVGTWSWDRWFSLAIVTGAIVAIIYLLTEEKLAKVLRLIPLGVLGLLLICAPFLGWVRAPSTTSSPYVAARQMPLATKPLAEWPKTGMEPGGRSIVLRVFGDMRPVIGEGSGYVLYCVFSDAREVAVSGNRCPRDGVTQMYAVNTRNVMNHLSYAYEH